MKLYVKSMVSTRCKMIVKSELESLGLHAIQIELGWIEIQEELSSPKLTELQFRLRRSGLEIVKDNKSILTDRIKILLIQMVHYNDTMPRVNYSVYVSESLHYDYTYLSNVFKQVEGTTIREFIITHKIEKVKELLLYDQLNLSSIARKLQYSNVGHLSNQFKKFTGVSPSLFKRIGMRRTCNLEDL